MQLLRREHAVEVILLPGCLEFPHALCNVRNDHVACVDPAVYRVSLRPSSFISFNFSIVAQLRELSPIRRKKYQKGSDLGSQNVPSNVPLEARKEGLKGELARATVRSH